MMQRTTVNLTSETVNMLKKLSSALNKSQNDVIESGLSLLNQLDEGNPAQIAEITYSFKKRLKLGEFVKHSIVLKKSTLDKLALEMRKRGTNRQTLINLLVQITFLYKKMYWDNINKVNEQIDRDIQETYDRLREINEKIRQLRPDLEEDEDPIDGISMAIHYLDNAMISLAQKNLDIEEE